MENFDWKTLSSRKLIENRWLTLRADRCRMPSGQTIDDYYVLEYPDWISVAAVTEQGEMVLVREYRHGMGQTLLQLPAGTMEPGDKTPEQTARRELLEETGYTGETFIPLCSLSPNPASQNNRIHGFLVTGAKKAAQPHLDETEQIETVLRPLNLVLEDLLANRLMHALHVPTLLQAFVRLGFLTVPPAKC